MKILYRLEHKDTKVGPFCWPDQINSSLGNSNLDSFLEARNFATAMPCINRDKLTITYFAEYSFAFLKLDQIKEWFGSYKETWDKLGFIVRVFSVRDTNYQTNEYQAVFLRDLAEVIEEVRIVEIC